LALIALSAGLAQAATFDVAALMQQLAQAKPGEVRFVEKRYSELLTAPLETSGTLRYVPPDRIEKHTLKPRVEHLVVTGDTLSLARGSRTRTMTLSEYPALRAFIESIRGTLAGDRATLERFYRLRLDGDEAHWVLSLVPTENDMRALVQSIRIDGTQARVREVEVRESGGDRSVLTVIGGG
jgi:hypothetical protein